MLSPGHNYLLTKETMKNDYFQSLFLCTYSQVNLTIVYRCVSPTMASVFQVYRSIAQQKILSVTNIDYCCNITCCQKLSVEAGSNLEEKEKTVVNNPTGGYLPYEYGTIHLLTIILISLLAIAMICQHFISFKKARKILPLLKLTSSGPFSTTRVDQSGIILPMIAYQEHRKENVKKKTVSQLELLNPAELLTIQDFGIGDGKIIDEEHAVDKESTNLNNNKTIETIEIAYNDENQDQSISIPQPLAPAYHPSKVVTQVWDGRHQVEQLYRYTSFDRLVYPPGYIT